MATAEIIYTGKRQTVVEGIAEGLIRFIAEKGLTAGDRLPPERELVEMVGASRLPLREALCVLKGLGIIESRHGKGVFIKPIDLGAVFGMLSPLLRTHAEIDIHQIFETRMHIEAAVAQLAAANRSDANLEALQRALDGMAQRIDDRSAYSQHDMAFHQELALGTGNTIFHVFMASITDLLSEVQFLYRDKTEFRRDAIAEHRLILDAVANRNAPQAKTEMESHIRNAIERM